MTRGFLTSGDTGRGAVSSGEADTTGSATGRVATAGVDGTDDCGLQHPVTVGSGTSGMTRGFLTSGTTTDAGCGSGGKGVTALTSVTALGSYTPHIQSPKATGQWG